MSTSLSETIAAVSTPLGLGGIGIIRISGPRSRAVGLALFQSAKKHFSDFKPYVLHHGWIMSAGGRALDDVLVSFMPGPGSYTGEDVLEINCHGGPALVQAIFEEILKSGIRAAGPGEFTFRAFMNGRMDLSQAESVAELIVAPTESSLRFASQKLSGALAQEIARLAELIRDMKTVLCADLDFPEDDLDSLSQSELRKGIQDVSSSLQTLLDNYSRYHCLREGALVVLAGQVNTGKSSLLNRLLGRSRAIVTPVPGTTRDYLEEMLNLRGLPVRLVDTAGLRDTSDQVEQAGHRQGDALVQTADLVCLVLDNSEPFQEENLLRAQTIGAQRVLLVINKVDLQPFAENIQDRVLESGFESVFVSAKTGSGLEALIAEIRKKLIGTEAEPRSDALVPNLRQKEKIRSALSRIQELEHDLEQGVVFDALTLYLDEAASTLAEITGEISSEDVLEEIFSRFCIGK